MGFRDHIKTTEGEVHEHYHCRNRSGQNVFAVHGVDDNGKSALVKPKVSREHLLPLVAQLPTRVIGMEACSGAHHWARLFRQHGPTVKLMAPKFVTPLCGAVR